MRVLVCGGRSFNQFELVARVLDALQVTVLMQGGAGGADRLALEWAQERGVPVITFPANWRLGKRGGPMRNQFMLDEGKPHLVVAFPGNTGTADMIEKAEAAGVRVKRIT